MRKLARAALVSFLLPCLAAAAPPEGKKAAPPLAEHGRAATAVQRATGNVQRGATGYWASSTCGGCHPRTLEQQVASHHEASFTNPIFQAQYFESVLPGASRDPALAGEARSCAACHAPV
ncbi:MAG TPA: hypothetical protein VLT61_10355, partial [Anaeromyxobacteraceae bacterium]|nr:hypothetical protein [Anaeromyxobacteraceae bacterium]